MKHSRSEPARARCWPALLVVATLAGPAGAVVVAGNPGQNAPDQSTAPAGYEDAWARIGALGAGSGVYLGNGYVLSARHVNGGNSFTVDGYTHTRISGTSVTLGNPEGLGLSAEADLWLNRYAVPDDSPLFGLDILELLDTALAAQGTAGVIIGEGLGQTTTTPVNVGGTNTGYAWGNGEQRRWGEVFMSDNASFDVNDRDVVGAQSFSFQQVAGRGNAADGDSGGGLFFLGDDGPVLGGIIHAVTLDANQNDNTAAFGNRTLFSDLSAYLDQINVVAGDLTGDGYVGVQDLDLVLANWGQAVQAGNWTLGDANGDGLVGEDDLNAVLAHFGEGQPPAPSVPEPASLTLMAVLGAWLGRRRGRI